MVTFLVKRKTEKKFGIILELNNKNKKTKKFKNETAYHLWVVVSRSKKFKMDNILYKINVSCFDKNYYLVNALLEYLENKNYEWIDKNELFIISKGIHTDMLGHHFFTFSHKGVSYHAYTKKIHSIINDMPAMTKLKINFITGIIRFD